METQYILEKDGEYIVMPTAKAAGEYLRVDPSMISGYCTKDRRCKGYALIRAKSEYDVYFDKRLKKIWSGMHERCEYKKHPGYARYGGRGIHVCEEWKEYVPFAKWALSNGYSETLTIDRIDPNGIYEPNNCRWVTMKAQMNNRRNNRIVRYQGKDYTIAQLAEATGIKKTTLKERLNTGISVEEAVERPIQLRTCGYRPSEGFQYASSDRRFGRSNDANLLFRETRSDG